GFQRAARELAAAALGRSSGRAAGDVAVDDAGLAQIVGGHFERDFVAGQNADVVLAHFSTGVRDDGVAVVKGDAKTGVGKDLSDESTHFNKFFFSHVFSLRGRTESRAACWRMERKRLMPEDGGAEMRSKERIGGNVPGAERRLQRRNGRV